MGECIKTGLLEALAELEAGKAPKIAPALSAEHLKPNAGVAASITTADDLEADLDERIRRLFEPDQPQPTPTQGHGTSTPAPVIPSAEDAALNEKIQRLLNEPGDQHQAPPLEPSFVNPYAEFAGPAFPLDVLPPTLAKFVDALRRNMGADPSAVAMAALAAVSGAINAATQVHAGEGWWDMPILWVLLIGAPSTIKSPIIDKVKKPLTRIDHQRHEAWSLDYKIWKQNKPAKGPHAPAPPRPPRCVINDDTPEKVAELLSRDQSGSIMVHDELAGWIAGFERYGSGAAERAFYLTSWNGGPFLKDRVGNGKQDQDAEIRVENLALCILGGIQPDRLGKLGDLTSDGLLQRFLIVLMKGAERGNQYHLVAAEEAAYDKLITSINSAAPQKYHFADHALEVRDRVIDYIHTLETVDGFSPSLGGAIGKLKGYFARICLVLHVAQRHDAMLGNVWLPDSCTLPPSFTAEARDLIWKIFKVRAPIESLATGLTSSLEISRRTAEAAERVLRQFLLPHMFGLYDVVVNGGQDRDMVRSIGDFILSSNKERLRPSDLTAGVRVLRGQPEHKIREWAGRFCAMDWLQPEEGNPGVPPKAWLVMPGLREHFAERRKQAQAAKAEVHEILRAGGSRRAP
jgi:hypothetical protein